MNREESAMKLIFLMKILILRRLVVPEENHSKEFKREDLRFLFTFFAFDE